MTENGYINTSIQGSQASIVSNTQALSQMIREAKASKGDLTVVLLDLANACKSIPQALIHAALDHYHIPLHIKEITSYFGGIQIWFKTAQFTNEWQIFL